MLAFAVTAGVTTGAGAAGAGAAGAGVAGTWPLTFAFCFGPIVWRAARVAAPLATFSVFPP